MAMRTTAGVLLIVGLLAGCAGGGKTDAAAPGTSTTPAAECTQASQALLDRIATGALDGTGMVPVTGQVYLSPDYGKVYFVAMRFTATGIEDQTGVWATSGLDSGITMSVDGFAKEFTDWPDSATTDAAITSTDPAVAVAIGCLG